ncbi:hypothetical protein OIU84_000082 [Salix udensis]|uniref:Cyclic nucleotide-binding domain-containing protein n=1 Tax=Salix udensis TaxID=889485 RepID=A0AAD6L528_9ROSI|nr:hypothetical protein OIU84_000082 [Salix udensis]
MEFKKGKLVRFNDSQNLEKTLPVHKTSAPLFKTEGGIINDRNTSGKVPTFGRFKHSLLIHCFCYLPSVISNGKSTCMDTDLNLGITVTCFRTFADVFYMLHIVIKFRTAYVSPSSRVFGRGELVMDPELIARRYLKSDFFIDLIAALPLPQIVIWSWGHPGICCRLSATQHAGNLPASMNRAPYHASLVTWIVNVLSSEFLEKFLYCLWWGLQNLSSYGQSLVNKHLYWGNCICHTHCHHGPGFVCPFDRKYADILAIYHYLRRDIQRHLCLDLVRRVPFFSQMDDQLLDAICERGKLESSTTNGGRTGFFNSIILRPGDFCGEELLAWALLPKSTLNLPSSTRTVRALEEVEAFALQAEDLKFVANQFRRLHSKKLQHTFRFYSYHWRTWATCFIQAAWRRHKKRMMAKSLSMSESFSLSVDGQTADDETDTGGG